MPFSEETLLPREFPTQQTDPSALQPCDITGRPTMRGSFRKEKTLYSLNNLTLPHWPGTGKEQSYVSHSPTNWFWASYSLSQSLSHLIVTGGSEKIKSLPGSCVSSCCWYFSVAVDHSEEGKVVWGKGPNPRKSNLRWGQTTCQPKDVPFDTELARNGRKMTPGPILMKIVSFQFLYGKCQTYPMVERRT